MSGLPYQGGMNSYMFDTSQYGVNMPDNTSTALNAGGKLSSMIPYIGPVLGAMFNFWSTQYQNNKQEEFYNKYMSPGSRMRQMIEAGINPNAAAQGISGAAPPQMNAAAPSSAFSAFGEQLGNSANTALTANLIKAQTRDYNASANLTGSLDVEQNIKNKYIDAEHATALDKLVADGEISRSTANMLKVDEYYKGANAYANYQQLYANLNKTAAEIDQLVANTVHEYASAYAAMMAGNLSEAQIQKVFSDIGLNKAMIKKINYECDVLEAQELSVYQDINESKARTIAQQIQNKFQQDYYDIWQNTGFNWNSDVEKSIVGAYQNLDIKAGDRMSHGLQRYLYKVDEAGAMSDKYMIDFWSGISNSCIHALGIMGAGAAINRGGSSRANVDRTLDAWRQGGIGD